MHSNLVITFFFSINSYLCKKKPLKSWKIIKWNAWKMKKTSQKCFIPFNKRVQNIFQTIGLITKISLIIWWPIYLLLSTRNFWEFEGAFIYHFLHWNTVGKFFLQWCISNLLPWKNRCMNQYAVGSCVPETWGLIWSLRSR